jgi:hypothetical protein
MLNRRGFFYRMLLKKHVPKKKQKVFDNDAGQAAIGRA